MSQSTISRNVTVINPEGLHARPAGLIVRAAKLFDATIRIQKGSEQVDCTSILSLLTLGATQGTKLTLSAEGSDRQQAIEVLCQLFESGFADPSQVENAESIVDS